MPFVLDLIGKTSKSITRNNDHLHYLAFVAKLNLWFAMKIEAQEKIKLLLKDTVKTRTEIAAQISLMTTRVVDELSKVRSEFEKVWHITNRTQSIQLLLNRYDRQAAYWNEIAETVQHGYEIDPSLKSQWLYHPKANPNMKDSAQVPKAFFRKLFSVEKGIRSAKVQLLGDSWVILSVNGKNVGEVSARRSLSLTVENQRAKIFDIAPLLTDSTNVIAVEAQNFQENGSAGINVYGEIVSSDGKIQVIATDNSWAVSDSASIDWNTPKFNANSWLLPVNKKYSVPVVAPNLATGRTSWFER